MRGDFYGLPTRILTSPHLRLEFLAEAGPRIVRLCLKGSDENQLAEVPDLSWATPYGDFFLRGGHRLWHAPESFPRTNVPDNKGLTVQETHQGVQLCQPTEADTGIRKSIEIQLHPDRPAVTLHHQLYNDSLWPIELAPWAITQAPLGGVAVLPQQAGPLDEPGLQPNRHLVLWPYTHWHDERLQPHDDYVLFQGQPSPAACKVGYFNRHGWIGYLNGDVFFCKRFDPQPAQPHPDFGCNVEVYAKDRFIELETLAPLQRLAPGQATTHVERWEFYTGLDAAPTLGGVRTLVQTLKL